MDSIILNPIYMIILTAIVVILIIMVIYMQYKIGKLYGILERFMGTKSKRHNLEEILMDYYHYVEDIEYKCNKMGNEIDILFNRLEDCIQKVGIIRYNPFGNMGGDLSYAIALLDEHNDGFIINTIFSREGSHTYCKPITGAKSEYELSFEEGEAIKKAIGENKKQKRGLESQKK